MAAKSATTGAKRKGGPASQKDGPKTMNKKAKFEALPAKRRAPAEKEDDFADFSDSEDGGVKLENQTPASKFKKGTMAKPKGENYNKNSKQAGWTPTGSSLIQGKTHPLARNIASRSSCCRNERPPSLWPTNSRGRKSCGNGFGGSLTSRKRNAKS